MPARRPGDRPAQRAVGRRHRRGPGDVSGARADPDLARDPVHRLGAGNSTRLGSPTAGRRTGSSCGRSCRPRRWSTGRPRSSSSVRVTRQAERLLKYHLSVRNLRTAAVSFDARYEVLGWNPTLCLSERDSDVMRIVLEIDGMRRPVISAPHAHRARRGRAGRGCRDRRRRRSRRRRSGAEAGRRDGGDRQRAAAELAARRRRLRPRPQGRSTGPADAAYAGDELGDAGAGPGA